MRELISESGLGCGTFNFYAPKLLSKSYDLAFALELAHKDLTYVREIIRRIPSATFSLDGTLNLLRTGIKEGRGKKDVSEICPLCMSSLKEKNRLYFRTKELRTILMPLFRKCPIRDVVSGVVYDLLGLPLPMKPTVFSFYLSFSAHRWLLRLRNQILYILFAMILGMAKSIALAPKTSKIPTPGRGQTRGSGNGFYGCP